MAGQEGSDRPVRRGRDPGSSCLVREPLGPRTGAGSKRKHPLPSIGDRFGELTVTGYFVGERGGVASLAVRCSCGSREHRVDRYNLLYGRTTRCDRCAKDASLYTRKKYWGYEDIVPDENHRARLLNRISACLGRCHNPNLKQFPHYGGRGIHVHAPWRTDRREFLRHIVQLEGWDDPTLELDRIDVDRGYEPGNLRFATKAENARNRRKINELQSRIAELERENERLRHQLRGAA